MEPGIIVEFIDQQRICCAVVLEDADQRLRLLTEENLEVHQRATRLSHVSNVRLDVGRDRGGLAADLKKTAARRRLLSQGIDIRELWEVLWPMGEWVDLPTMTGLCFPENPNGDHESAVIRACFENRIYFKFNNDAFFPHSEDQVRKNIENEREKERRRLLLEKGVRWLKDVMAGQVRDAPEDMRPVVDILKSFYLFGKESPQAAEGRALLAGAGLDSQEKIFDLLTRVGVWGPHEPVDLLRYDIPVTFSEDVRRQAEAVSLGQDFKALSPSRRNLTDLPMMTIDGQGTLDFDDAISVETLGGYYRIGVHIADVGACVARDTVIDREVARRATSIYMPDIKISMLPPVLAENACSLKVGEVRLAISIFCKISRFAEIFEFEVVPSIIRVSRQLTYSDADMMVDSDEAVWTLHEIACNFRNKRISNGAIHIAIPEISVRVFDNGEISVRKTDRESPGRMFVSEIMILANWLMARFLAEKNMPAIFRSQPDPKARLFSQKKEGTLFQNWMQRRMLNRVVISPKPHAHSGLGLDKYLTATSPIRKYADLVTQRQIRGCFGMDTPYTAQEIQALIDAVREPQACAMLAQKRRHHYWLLRYLEKKIGTVEEAIVLDKRRDHYGILLTAYLVECTLHVSSPLSLKPQDIVLVTISHVDARREVLTVSL